MELRPYQVEAIKAIETEWGDRNRTLLVLPTGCHALHEKLLLANGEIKAVEDIHVGDNLMGFDGTARKVLHKTIGHGALYRIIPVKGEPFIVSRDHKLTLVRTSEKKTPKYPCQRRGGELVDVAINEYLTWSSNKKHLHKLIRCEGVEEFEQHPREELPIDPYFLGVLLGDGSMINSVSVTTMDAEVVSEITKQATKRSLKLRTVPAGKAKTYFFAGAEGVTNSFIKDLRALRLYGSRSEHKFVPECYKLGTYGTRLQIIAGLSIQTEAYAVAGTIL